MKARSDELALQFLTQNPSLIAKQIMREMANKHGELWEGLSVEQILGQVRRTRVNMNYGDAFCTV